jgi:hypothetical protein
MTKEFYWASDKICHYVSREVNMDDIVQKRMTAEVEGDVGIWHESYLLKNNNYECVYNNMPVFGLAKATNHIPVTKKNKSARDRLNAKIT